MRNPFRLSGDCLPEKGQRVDSLACVWCFVKGWGMGMTRIRRFIRKLYSFFVECIWGPIFTLVFMVFYLIFYFIRALFRAILK